MHVRVFLGFLGGQVGKVAAVHIIGLAGGEQVQRYGAELKRRAALQKQDLMCVRHGQCGTKSRLHILENIRKGLTSVTHLHHRHARAMIIEQFRLRLLEHFLRQDRRSGRKIERFTSGHRNRLQGSKFVTCSTFCMD